jgi:peptidyl-prolyl cis-trans isomerase A (cyclophilin A)
MVAASLRAAALMVVCTAVLTAQTVSTVTGTVSAGGRGLAAVAVRVCRPGEIIAVATVATDAEGRYRLTTAPGVYRLEFQAAGFDTAIRPGVVLLPDSSLAMDVVMARSGTGSVGDAIGELQPGEVGVHIDTTFGTILLAIDTKHAPVTAANFLKHVDAGLYNGGRFHRATRPDNYTPLLPNRPMMELIQGGINPDRRADGFPAIPLERTTVTGLKHVAGTVSMARGTAADTATSDFFILLDDQPSLDAGGKRFDDGQGGAAFGRVIFGLGVVRKIQQRPVQGQNLTPPILILRIGRMNQPEVSVSRPLPSRSNRRRQ